MCGQERADENEYGVRVLAGPGGGRPGTVVGVRWPRTGPPTAYQVRVDPHTTLTVDPDGLAPIDRPAEPEPALT